MLCTCNRRCPWRTALWFLGLLAAAWLVSGWLFGCGAATRIDPARNSATHTVVTTDSDGSRHEDTVIVQSQGAGGSASGDQAKLDVDSKAGAVGLPSGDGKKAGGAETSNGGGTAFAEISAMASLWWVRVLFGLAAGLCGWASYGKFQFGNVIGAMKLAGAAVGCAAGVFHPVAGMIGVAVALGLLIANALHGIRIASTASLSEHQIDATASRGTSALQGLIADLRTRLPESEFGRLMQYVLKNHGAVLVPPAQPGPVSSPSS